MAKNKKKKAAKTEFIVKKSIWAEFSLLWVTLAFVFAAFLILLKLDYNAYSEGLLEHIRQKHENNALIGINNIESYVNALLSGEINSADQYIGQGVAATLFGITLPFSFGILGITKLLYVKIHLPFLSISLIEIITFISMYVGIIIIILMIMYLTAKKIKVKKSAYIFKGNTLIVSTGHIFNREEEVRRVLYSPGMSISVQQTFKGKFFNYGDLIISLGYGDAGEIYMRGVKNPLKRKKELLVLMRKNCSVVPQHGYTMNPYSMMYNYMDAYSTMNTPKA